MQIYVRVFTLYLLDAIIVVARLGNLTLHICIDLIQNNIKERKLKLLMTNENQNIKSYFEGVLENIDIILNNNFYKNKDNLITVRKSIAKWYDGYKKHQTLKEIDPKELKNLDLEITDFFADYVEIEPVNENYAERLSYDFDELERYWKDEMLGNN